MAKRLATALFVIPSKEILPHVNSYLIPHLGSKFSKIVVGTDFACFEESVKSCESYAICCGIFVPGMQKLLADLLSCNPNAKPLWIHSLTAGVEQLVNPMVKAAACPVTNAKGCFSSSLAEYVICSCLHFEKQIPLLQRNKNATSWDKFVMGELRGLTIGIVGFGDIGHAIARLALAFGMKVVAVRRRSTSNSDEAKLASQMWSWEERHKLLEVSDFVVACLPGTPLTVRCLNKDFFGAMKSTAVFINVGRGATVNEDDLIAALKNNELKGAALDVFEVEPLPPTSELWSLDNVLLSPHNADNTASYANSKTNGKTICCCY